MHFLIRNRVYRIAAALLLAGVLPLLAACAVSEEEAQRLVDHSISQTLTAVPPATPQPTATPAPTVTPPPTSTPSPTPTPQPTPTPLPQSALAQLFPTPTPVVLNPTATPKPAPGSGPGVSSTQSIQLGDSVTLVVDPAQPATGRPVRFQLSGMTPWKRFSVTILNPVNVPVTWTRDDQVFIVDGSGQLIKTETLYTDGAGQASWVRWNALDTEGQWTVQIAVDGKRYEGRYVLTPLQLATASSMDLGIAMRRYSGSSSEVYLSPGTPASVALDLSGLLPSITDNLESWLLLASVQIPNVYLFSSSDHFKQAISATGATGVSPFASGIYRPSGRFKGVYVILDEFTSETVKTLVHEQTHLLIEEVASSADIPAWLNEGLATYLEIHVSGEFGAAALAQQEGYRKQDTVKAGLDSGKLFPLSRLVSQQEWNAQADRELLNLQYAQGYMAVRYLTERYGNSAPGLILEELERRGNFDAALVAVAGVTQAQFERDWTDWLGRRQDPAREQVRQYVAQVEAVLAEAEAVSDDRGAFLTSAAGSGSFSQRVAPQTQLVNRAKALAGKGSALAYPAQHQVFHQDLAAFLTVYQGWLQRELDAYSASNNSLITQANAMIPEVNARQFSLRRQVNSIQLNYQLRD